MGGLMAVSFLKGESWSPFPVQVQSRGGWESTDYPLQRHIVNGWRKPKGGTDEKLSSVSLSQKQYVEFDGEKWSEAGAAGQLMQMV